MTEHKYPLLFSLRTVNVEHIYCIDMHVTAISKQVFNMFLFSYGKKWIGVEREEIRERNMPSSCTLASRQYENFRFSHNAKLDTPGFLWQEQRRR